MHGAWRAEKSPTEMFHALNFLLRSSLRDQTQWSSLGAESRWLEPAQHSLLFTLLFLLFLSACLAIFHLTTSFVPSHTHYTLSLCHRSLHCLLSAVTSMTRPYWALTLGSSLRLHNSVVYSPQQYFQHCITRIKTTGEFLCVPVDPLVLGELCGTSFEKVLHSLLQKCNASSMSTALIWFCLQHSYLSWRWAQDCETVKTRNPEWRLDLTVAFTHEPCCCDPAI